MKAVFLGFIVLLLVAEVLPWLWFGGSGEKFVSLNDHATIRGDSLEGERSNDLLGFDQGVSYSNDQSQEITLTVMTWEAGNSHGLMDAFGHSPEVCLPVSGARLLAEHPTRELELGGRIFEVEGWMFSHPLLDEKIHAFKLAHSSHPELVAMALGKQLIDTRLLLFRERREMPSIEIAIGVVQGSDHPESAWKRFARFAQSSLNSPTTIPLSHD